jgi:hypothetical protein
MEDMIPNPLQRSLQQLRQVQQEKGSTAEK